MIVLAMLLLYIINDAHYLPFCWILSINTDNKSLRSSFIEIYIICKSITISAYVKGVEPTFARIMIFSWEKRQRWSFKNYIHLCPFWPNRGMLSLWFTAMLRTINHIWQCVILMLLIVGEILYWTINGIVLYIVLFDFNI